MDKHQKAKQLRILQWNVNGIGNKSEELLNILSENTIDVALLQESWLNSSKNLFTPGFKQFRRDRQVQTGGGVIILVKNSLITKEIPFPALKSLEAVGASIATAIGEINLWSLYSPPRKLDPDDMRFISRILGEKTFAGGDLNAKNVRWGASTTNAAGRKIRLICEERKANILTPSTFTHYSHHGSADILDFALTANLPATAIPITLDSSASDHLPLLYCLNCSPSSRIPAPKTGLNFNKFTRLVADNVYKLNELPLQTRTDADLCVDRLTTTIRDCADAAKFTLPSNSVPDAMPQHILTAIKDRNRARKQWQLLRTAENHNIFKTKRNRVNRLLTAHRHENWDRKIASLSTEDNTVWKMARALKNPYRATPPLQSDDTIASTDSEKADVFANMLEKRFTNSLESELEEEAEAHFLSLRQCPIDEPAATCTRELLDVVRGLKNRSAPGHDAISNKLLKNLPASAFSFLVTFFNFLFHISYFPTSWKRAKIIMLLKPLKPASNPSSYRPISLLCTLSKLFETLIHNRLKHHLLLHNCIRPEQTGFRSKTSTTHQILRLTEKIASGFNARLVTQAVFLDLEAAFDRVWTLGLLLKLSTFPLPIYLQKLIQSFTTDRTFYVKFNLSSSQTFPIASGVPQGAILSPTLFNLFVNDLPSIPGTETFLYADDTTFLAQGSNPRSTAEHLQRQIDSYEDWADTWKLSANPKKCVHVTFSRRPRAGIGDPIFYGNTELPNEDHTKFLGVTLDKRLTWKTHIRNATGKAKAAAAALGPLFHCRSKLPLKTKITLFKSLLKPLLGYASPVWLMASKTHLMKIQKTENVLIRKVVSAPWYIRNRDLRKDLKITPILHELKANLVSFKKSIPRTNNELLVNLWQEPPNPAAKHRTPNSASLPDHIPSP
jgi:hypothetical protein